MLKVIRYRSMVVFWVIASTPTRSRKTPRTKMVFTVRWTMFLPQLNRWY